MTGEQLRKKFKSVVNKVKLMNKFEMMRRENLEKKRYGLITNKINAIIKSVENSSLDIIFQNSATFIKKEEKKQKEKDQNLIRMMNQYFQLKKGSSISTGKNICINF